MGRLEQRERRGVKPLRRQGTKNPSTSVIRVRLPIVRAPKVAPGRRKSMAAGREFPPPSRKKQHGELSPGAYRCRIDHPPSVEKLQQLLAGAIFVPSPVALDDFKQRGGRLLALVLGIEKDREIKTRLMIFWIGREPS
jgi:hypothetical protein